MELLFLSPILAMGCVLVFVLLLLGFLATYLVIDFIMFDKVMKENKDESANGC